jgi:hypothetical protein
VSSRRQVAAAADDRSAHQSGRRASAASIARTVPFDHQPESNRLAPGRGSKLPFGSCERCEK